MNAVPMVAAALTMLSALVLSAPVLSEPGEGVARRQGRGSGVEHVAPSAAACGDMLMEIGRKPSQLEFLGCRTEKVHGFLAVIADYRVEGRDAEAIERHFVASAKMPAAGFYCCGWETLGPAGQLRHGGVVYDIAMTSVETLLNQRADWPKIPWFSVAVTRYLEEP